MAARVSEVALFVQGTSPKAEVTRHASAGLFLPAPLRWLAPSDRLMIPPSPTALLHADLGRRRRRKIPASVRGQAPETDCT